MTDRRVAEAVAAMGGVTVTELGLRFDRVVVRVLDRLEHCAEAKLRTDVSVALTLTAPVRAPGKTAAALQQEIGALLRMGRAGEERSVELHGNRAELRFIARAAAWRSSLLGFVHNPDVESAAILALAERWLRSSG